MDTARHMGRFGCLTVAFGVTIAVLGGHDIALADSPAAPGAPVADNDPYIGQPSAVEQAMKIGLDWVTGIGKRSGANAADSGVSAITSASPPEFATRGLDVQRTDFHGWAVWSIRPPHSTSDKQVVAIHGGGFKTEATVFHWVNYADIARTSGATVVVPIYPLVDSGGTAGSVVPGVADLISTRIAAHGADNVAVYGDSAGGTIAMAAVQTLVARRSATPARMVLVSPWLDLTVSDPRSGEIDDPVLDADSLRAAGRQWAGGLAADDPLVSPLHGSLDGLPPTTVYSGSDDLLSPDVLRLRNRVGAENDHGVSFVLLHGGMHGWPGFFFLPEAIAVSPAITYELTGVCDTRPVSDALRYRNLGEVVQPGRCEP